MRSKLSALSTRLSGQGEKVPRSQLEKLEPAEIVEFGRIFEEYWIRAYTWDLWAAAYIIGEGCSADGFLDFRGWLISKGEEVYERAMRDPESLARILKDDEDCKYEGFQYVASQAWKNKPGNHGLEYPDQGSFARTTALEEHC